MWAINNSPSLWEHGQRGCKRKKTAFFILRGPARNCQFCAVCAGSVKWLLVTQMILSRLCCFRLSRWFCTTLVRMTHIVQTCKATLNVSLNFIEFHDFLLQWTVKERLNDCVVEGLCIGNKISFPSVTKHLRSEESEAKECSSPFFPVARSRIGIQAFSAVIVHLRQKCRPA